MKNSAFYIFFFILCAKWIEKMLHNMFIALMCNYVTITHLTSYPTLRRICVLIKSYTITVMNCFTSLFRSNFNNKNCTKTMTCDSFCTFFSFSDVWRDIWCKRNIGQRQKCCNLVHQYGVDDVIEYTSMNMTEQLKNNNWMIITKTCIELLIWFDTFWRFIIVLIHFYLVYIVSYNTITIYSRYE